MLTKLKTVVMVALFLVALPWAVRAETLKVSGVVFDESGLPVAGVEVRLGDQLAVTNQDGAFEIRAEDGSSLEFSVRGESVVLTDSAEIIVNLGAKVSFEVEGAEVVKDVETPAEIEVQTGTVKGRIVSEEGTPIAAARVFVRGLPLEARTDAQGRFELELPTGEQVLAFVHPDFSSLDHVVQVEGEVSFEVALTPAAVSLDDYTVSAPRIEGNTIDLLVERRESDAVMEVIGAEEMSKTGASSAADAVARVTGITVVGGKYVYVRGLGDRYSSTLLNGATLPSPEPEKRVVPLDLFPTDLLDSVLVQKTFSPDMPGEFGGGVVSLRTRGFPESFQADVSLSLGINASTTFRDGLSSPGGSLDWLGIDDGTRRMPDELRAASEDQPLKEGDIFGTGGYTPAELEYFGELVPNTWALRNRTNLPSIGLQGSIGDGLTLFGKKSGYRFGLTYDRSTDHETLEQNYYIVGAGGQLERSNRYTFTTTNDNIVLGGILTTGIELDARNRLIWTTVMDRISDAEDRVYVGFNRDVDSTIRVTRHRWLERQLLFTQLKGEHELQAGPKIDWHYVFAQAGRLEPDRRETRYDLRPTGDFQLSDRPEGNSRVFSDLVDNSHDGAASVKVPLELGGIEPTISAGLAGMLKDREVDTRRFKYFSDSLDPRLLTLPPEELFGAENIGQGGLQFLEITRPTDNYSASQRVAAVWADSKWPIFRSFEAGVGARLEYSEQKVNTFELFNPSATPIGAKLETLDVLPAIFATYGLSETMKLRLASSRTVSRPDFRELSPMLFNDVTGGIAVQGNPDLERALITHVDTRWEWYPSASESLSVGAFFKHFDSPIESILVPGAQQLKTFANAEGARNLGAEIEARKSFDFLAEILRDFYFATNVSLINSKIEIDPTSGIQTSSERPLQGQSPWVVNAQLGWDDVDWGSSVAILFNAVGPRISEVGAQGAPDIYEEAVPRLELVARQKLGDTFKLGFKATNLLDPDIRYTQGESVVSSLRTGRKFSISLGASF